MKHDHQGPIYQGPISQPYVDLDHRHAFAVCQGVGERLRDAMDREHIDVSSRLSAMIARLPELDTEDSPSLVPSISDAQ